MLNSRLRRLLWMNGLFGLAGGLSGLFTNVYLFRLRPGVTTPALYTLWQMATILFVLPLMGALVKRRGAAVVNVLGTALYAAFYLTLLLLQERAADHLAFLGIFMGVAISAYALAGHVLAYDVTDESNREIFYNRSGLYGSISGLIAPLVSGWLVSSFPGLTGYRIIFIASFALFAWSAYLGLGLHVKQPPQPYRLWAVLPGQHRAWHRMLVAFLLMGLRDGLFTFGIPLLVYLSSSNGEAGLGNFTFLTSLVGLGSFYVVGRLMTPTNRERLFPLGAFLMMAACMVIGLGANWWVMLAYGLLITLANPIWSTAFAVASFHVIREAGGDAYRIEMLAAREIPLNLGRVLTIGLFLAFTPEGSGLLQLLLAVSGVAFPLAWLFVRRPPSAA
jgi:YQGE family putative transporter